MKKLFLAITLLFTLVFAVSAQTIQLPDSIYSGKQGALHVQGVVVDQNNGHVYFSFTDKLVKMDLKGNLIGSVTGFVGHLGDLDITEDGKIYGSLEYKNDAIGKGVKKQLGVETVNEDGFYIAIFECSRITRPNMDAEKEALLRTVYIKEAVIDYNAKVKVNNRQVSHRFACSGIDGIAFAPAIGSSNKQKKYLYVAYGVYGDTTRNDNDHQVILKYDISNWAKYERGLSQSRLHHSGPEQPLAKYFVKTGNTRYGIQNLAYDPTTGNLFAAVYKGSKSQFPNYDLFVIDGHQKPGNGYVLSDDQQVKVSTLALLGGWSFKWGATGLCPLGDGLFYISHNEKTKDGQQQSTIYKYKWVGDDKNAFVIAK
ncbi:hypothetical protein [Pedobacter insulae]|uniref:Uncharacterized protein n=1 Tax=Pedobacter insulae TaxID=414048 RepID=A0A1I3AEM1_9SPHI|nr:hypothetical protein [Pedobacter insulae]SFH48552.1 hypothetical protein SAMN04489864_11453 [Pedobacter insulae]